VIAPVAWQPLDLVTEDDLGRLSHYFLTRIKVQPSGCWFWTGNRVAADNKTGDYYGVAREDPQGPRTGAHRVVYEILVGPIPDGLTLDHLCRVTLSVCPNHLEPTTRWENVRRSTNHAAQNLRRDRCPRGHKYDKVNAKGWRSCSTCDKARRVARRKGVPVDVRDAVLIRAAKSCERCGVTVIGSFGSVHHRTPRQMGGSVTASEDTSRMVLLCGSGTTGCHGTVERERLAAYHAGWLVRQGEDPHRIPIVLWDGRTVFLTSDGRYSVFPEGESA
jgi:hypothetical protein